MGDIMKKSIFVLISVFITFYAFDLLASTITIENPTGIYYSRGHRKNDTTYKSANACVKVPCVVSQKGKIKFNRAITEKYAVEIGVVNKGKYASYSINQTPVDKDDHMSERVLQRKLNKKVLNIDQALYTGKLDVVYVYGLLLEYPMYEGDLIVVALTDPTNILNKYYYYFRYHRDGVIFDFDVAIINPIDVFWPNPNNRLKGTDLTAGLSFSWGWNMDPEKKYNFLRKFLHCWKFNITTGVMRRNQENIVGADRVGRNYIDGFIGGGLTFLNIINGGFAVNMARSPHAVFPYVGVELKSLFNLFQSLGKSRNKKWEEYIRQEQNSRMDMQKIDDQI